MKWRDVRSISCLVPLCRILHCGCQAQSRLLSARSWFLLKVLEVGCTDDSPSRRKPFLELANPRVLLIERISWRLLCRAPPPR